MIEQFPHSGTHALAGGIGCLNDPGGRMPPRQHLHQRALLEGFVHEQPGQYGAAESIQCRLQQRLHVVHDQAGRDQHFLRFARRIPQAPAMGFR